MPLFFGEAQAVKRVIAYADQYGYGNLIAHLRRAWAEMLMEKYGISEKAAIDATNSEPYPIEWTIDKMIEEDGQ